MRRLIRRAAPRKVPPAASPRQRPAGRPAPRQWSRATRRGLLAFVFAALVIGAPLYAWRAGHVGWALVQIQDTATTVSANAGYTIDDVISLGRHETSVQAVLDALGVTRGQPIMDFDPQAAKQRLEALGWVRIATVQRQLPGTIRIHLVERRPMARWQHDGRIVLIDRDGVVIGTNGLDLHATLPLVVGDDAPDAAPELFALLITEPGLFARVTAAVRVGMRRWDIRFDNGVAVQLPEDAIADAWHRLAVLAYDHALFERAVAVVDLRLADRMTLRLDGESAANEKDMGPRI